MDIIEKKLTRKYGSAIIPQQGVIEALKWAADLHLIDQKDVQDIGAMGVSEFCEHVAKIRRGCLLSNNINEELGFALNDNIREETGKEDPGPVNMEKVLKAYLEYERKTSSSRLSYTKYVLVIVVAIVVINGLYTPEPY